MEEKIEQIWPNERIAQALIQLSSEDGELTAEAIVFFIYNMRDDYESRLNNQDVIVTTISSERGTPENE